MEHYYNEDHTKVAILTIAKSDEVSFATENLEMAMDKRVIEFVFKEAKEDECGTFFFEQDFIPFFDGHKIQTNSYEEYKELFDRHYNLYNIDGVFSSFLKALGYIVEAKYHNVYFSIDWVPVGKRFRVKPDCYTEYGDYAGTYEDIDILDESEWVLAE